MNGKWAERTAHADEKQQCVTRKPDILLDYENSLDSNHEDQETNCRVFSLSVGLSDRIQ
jgi:hypothetical protein